jgi:alpha-1,2-mannosyltransferase
MAVTSDHPARASAPPRYGQIALVGLFILVSVVICNLVDRAIDVDSSRTLVAKWLLHPGDAWVDSWAPMLDALDWLNEHHTGTLYQSIFFQQHIKFQYPPTSLLPLAAMDWFGIEPTPHRLNSIGWAWIAVTLLAMTVYSVALAVRSGAVTPGDRRSQALTAITFVFATLTFFPIMIAYSLGQAQAWINALFMLACLCWIYDRRMIAGMLVGGICLLKPQFGLFLIWAILRREWPFLIGWCVVVAVGIAASLAAFGFANNLDYLSVLRFLSDRGETHYYNQSMNGLLNRLMYPDDSMGSSQGLPTQFPPHNALVYFGTLLSSIALVLAALFLRGRRSDRGGLLDFLTAALTFTMAAPLAWIHHYGDLLPILTALLFALLARPSMRGQWGLALVLAISYVIAANLIYPANFTAETRFNFVQSDLFFAGLATLWLLYRVSAPPSFDGLRRAAGAGLGAPSSPARR